MDFQTIQPISLYNYDGEITEIISTKMSKFSPLDLIILALFAGLLVAGFTREINKKTSIPYTPMLFIIGMFVGMEII
jgi:hypothetical protein